MTFNDFGEMAALLFAISLASERVVSIFKTALPKQLAEERRFSNGQVNVVGDRGRRLIVMLITYLACYATAGFIAGEKFMAGSLKFGSDNDVELHTALVGLLASGGSSFWNNILGYTKAVKDVNYINKAKEEIKLESDVNEFRGNFAKTQGAFFTDKVTTN